MYKFLLCWRYLRTRYIALASIISVTLGVATMIVVNSVMSGFSHEMHKRFKGILSDIVLESQTAEGAENPELLKQEIVRTIGQDLHGLSAVVHVPAMLNFQHRGTWITRQINLIGIDVRTHAEVSDFGQYLLHPENRSQLNFLLREGGYDSWDTQSGAKVQERKPLRQAGWPYRRFRVQSEREYQLYLQQQQTTEQSVATVPAGEEFPTPSTEQDPATLVVSPEPAGQTPPENVPVDPTASSKPKTCLTHWNSSTPESSWASPWSVPGGRINKATWKTISFAFQETTSKSRFPTRERHPR